MKKIKEVYVMDYFKLTNKKRDLVAEEIATTVLSATIMMFNNYEKGELPDIFDLAITNLQSLETTFVDEEQYSFAAMMRDSIKKLQNDLSTMVEPEL
jgi:hypothetical protein